MLDFFLNCRDGMSHEKIIMPPYPKLRKLVRKIFNNNKKIN